MKERTQVGAVPNMETDKEIPAPALPADSGTQGEDAALDLCMICDQPRTEGIHICEAFICGDCEREMVETDVSDARYPYFIMRMRQIWHRRDA